MPTSARVRKSVDVMRMGRAMSQPGIDPRTWVTMGRVEDDPQAVRWVHGMGWIADVRLTGGPLDGETEVPCRVAGNVQGEGTGEFVPLTPGCEVAVLLMAGNAEEAPLIVGRVNNRGGCEAPEEVNGLPILDGTEGSSSAVAVSPFDTEIVVSENNRREEYRGDTFHQSASRVIETEGNDSLCLGDRDADQHYVRGEDYTDAVLAAFETILPGWGVIIPPATVPTPLVQVPGVTAGLVEAAKAQLLAALSQKIKGE